MELRVLQYFLAVAREQSISAAAVSLNLTQPTLSTQLKSLEEELGTQLLIRGSKGSRKVTLTEDGMLLRKRAEELIELAEKTEKEIAGNGAVLSGEIAIGSAETEIFEKIAEAIMIFHELHRDVSWKIHSAASPEILELIDKGLLDFGLIYESGDPLKFHSVQIPKKDEWGLLALKSDPIAKKKVLRPDDLKDLPLILPVRKSARTQIESWMQIDSLPDLAVCNLIFNMIILVKAGAGYAVVLDRLADVYDDSNLCFIPFDPPLYSNVWLVWKKYKALTRAQDLFLKTVLEVFDLNQNNASVL